MDEQRSSSMQAISTRHETNTLLQASLSSSLRGADDLSGDYVPAPLTDQVIERTVAELAQGNTHYVDVAGVPALRQALTGFVTWLSSPVSTLDHLMVTAGVQEARFLSIQVLGAMQGSIAIPDVCDPGVRLAAGVRPLELRGFSVDSANGALPALDGIRHVLEAGCRLLYLESPSRLTGAMFDRESVARIAELVVRHDAAVIWDQGLAPWVTSGEYASIASRAGMSERSVLLGEAFPGIGLEPMLVAYLSAPQAWLPALVAQKQQMSICTGTPSQYAAIAAAETYVATHTEQLRRLQTLNEQARLAVHAWDLEPLPGAAVNVLAAAGGRPAMQRLAEHGFRAADGAAFGAPEVLRLAITPLNRLARVVGPDTATKGA